jgi:chromosome partitioning protein
VNQYTIAVCHQKGGVAKTTTVSSLGAALAELDLRVLLIDLDPSGNLTYGLGLNPGSASGSAADILLGNETLERICRPTMIPGLDIIPSNSEMVMVSRFLNLRPRFEYLLRESLEQKSKNGQPGYDYVLIDCPPTLGSLTLAALTAARLALIPTQCEYYSLQALDGIFKTTASVRSKTNPQLQYRLLVTMFDRRGLLHTRVLGMLRERFAPVMFENMIGFDSKLRESQLAGMPITAHATRTRATFQYRALAKEIHTFVVSEPSRVFAV